MNEIMDILVDNYIYVALGSLFLIIVLIGIVVSSNRKRKKAKNPDMVSMSDVTTGSINDVANNLNVQNNPEMPVGMKPLNVAEVHPSTNVPVAEEAIPQELYAPMGSTPVAPVEEVKPVPTVDTNPYATNVTPTMEQPKEPSFQPVFGPETVAAPLEPQPVNEVPIAPVVEPVQEIPVIPVAEPVQEIPVAPMPEASKPEVLDFDEPIAEGNPLNGEAPVSEPNNQNI
jgi:hypothetical protein